MYTRNVEGTTEVPMYAVFRNGVRVSDSEYDSKSGTGAEGEYNYWAGILKRFPDGSKLEIRQVRSYAR